MTNNKIDFIIKICIDMYVKWCQNRMLDAWPKVIPYNDPYFSMWKLLKNLEL